MYVTYDIYIIIENITRSNLTTSVSDVTNRIVQPTNNNKTIYYYDLTNRSPLNMQADAINVSCSNYH